MELAIWLHASQWACLEEQEPLRFAFRTLLYIERYPYFSENSIDLRGVEDSLHSTTLL